MTTTLEAPDLRRVLDVVEDAERPETLDAFRATTLAALASRVGFARTTFFLTGPPAPPTEGTDGVQHGFRPIVMEQYVEQHRADPFRGSLAVTLLRRDGMVSFDQLRGSLAESERDYVDGFLTPNRIAAQLCLWLDTGLSTHGIVCVLHEDPDGFDVRSRALLHALRPHLGNLLAHHVRQAFGEPRVDLSPREREVVRLVTDGLTNGEIARRLGISEDTVKKHVSRSMARLGVRNRTELALRSVGWR